MAFQSHFGPTRVIEYFVFVALLMQGQSAEYKWQALAVASYKKIAQLEADLQAAKHKSTVATEGLDIRVAAWLAASH